jgi:hypothetical protein
MDVKNINPPTVEERLMFDKYRLMTLSCQIALKAVIMISAIHHAEYQHREPFRVHVKAV